MAAVGDAELPDAGWDRVAGLAHDLVGAWACWAPTLSPDGSRVAYVSDRTGSPQLWVRDVRADTAPQLLQLSADPVLAVHWSPDGEWLACSLATGGGVRSEVWVVRPDGSDGRRVAGGDRHAALGPWARAGHDLVVTVSGAGPNECVLVDPVTGTCEPVATGELVTLLDLTADGRFALLRDGTRGAQFCRLVDRAPDVDHRLLPDERGGSTDAGLFRPAPPGEGATFAAYLVSDAGRPRRELITIAVHADGRPASARTLAAREDAELEDADADAAGRVLVLIWNVDGHSEVELLDPATGARTPCPGLPGAVASGPAMARNGSCVVLSVEGPSAPRQLWCLDVATLAWSPVTTGPSFTGLVEPELVRFEADDGLPLTGWLYRARRETGAAMLSLHGGPEAQERPVFTPQHQVLAAAGITVFAPNIRGSSGFGRAFVHADDRDRRLDAIGDVAACARLVTSRGWAERVAVTGRSYGGYATLMALVRFPTVFAAGVDICGMSDLRTFFRDTEPWIAAAAVSKYGHPVYDAELLAELSPLSRADGIRVPVLVVHGELDSNVPLNEATQLVARLRECGLPVEYLELAGEGHEYRRFESQLLVLQELTRFLTRVLAVG